MSYYSDNDWRYYSEDYLEHASLRDRWNDLMSKTTIDDNIKKAAGDARTAVSNGLRNAGYAANTARAKVSGTLASVADKARNATRPVSNAIQGANRNARKALRRAAAGTENKIDDRIVRGFDNATTSIAKGVGKVRNMFGKKYEWPGGNNSEQYNKDYYERFKERILAKQKEYRQKIRDAVAKSENKVDDRILGAVDKAVSGARYGLTTAKRNVRVGADLMRRNPKVVLNQGVKNVKNAAGRAYDSAREAAGNVRDTARNLRDAAGNAYDSARDTVANGVNRFIDATPTNWDNNLRDSYNRRKTVKAGSQRRNSNRG